MMAGQTYYDILGVTPDSTDAEIRRAYYIMALCSHPDRMGKRVLANERPGNRAFHDVNRAYNMLKTKPQREAYNRYLQRQLQCKEQRHPLTEGSQTVPTTKSNSGYVWKLFQHTAAIMAILKEIFWPFALKQEVTRG